MIPDKVLENDRLYLRSLQTSDITEEYISGLNDPEVNRYLVDVRRSTQTYNSVRDFINLNQESPSCILFGIFVKDEPNPFIGTLRVSGIETFHYTASLGICVFAKRAWKRGYAVQSIQMIKDHLFKNLGLHYLEAGLYTKNMNSYKAFSRAGFSESHCIKQKFRLEKEFEDAVYLCAINPEFNFSVLAG